ncbi:MAG: AAA family ATPase [Bacteroidaceae bacterium]|nr:AAA family ATPase [Bacteroidaceae bacterium]
MRILLLFRGAPGCGKSTFIDRNGLRPYALSADEIRLQCQSAQQTADGRVEISQKNEQDVWNMLFKLLEIRMRNGEFTVIDATNSKTSEINRYKEMCDTYRYRIFCIDMTDLPIEECKRRNVSRPVLKQVPESVIDKMYSRFATQKIPSGVKVIKPEDLDTIWMRQVDFSGYDKVVHVGDIHGCYTALMEYFKDGLDDNTMYIFVGDLIDRGIENVEVVNWFTQIINKKNVLVLEGNHERWLWIYAHGGVGRSKEFELVTRKQLEEAHVDVKAIRQLYRKLGQCAWYKYDDKDIFVSHAGIAALPDNLSFMSTEQMIKGVGNYNDYEIVADSWMRTTSDSRYQIFGHRNTKASPMKLRDRVYDLEGEVEFGGHLRILELSHDGFKEIEIKNDVFKEPEEIATQTEMNTSSIADVVLALRANKHVTEKQFDNISSFNFTRDAFYDKVWDEQTVKARGLYIDTSRMKVAARAYDKFFNINERPETKFDMLKYSLKFPVTCYVKENGFLGIVSYDADNDDLFITTKSNPTGNYAEIFKKMLFSKMSTLSRDKMKEVCRDKDVSFVFECVDMENDPHVIEYPESDLFLLAIVKNQMEFEQATYENLQNIGSALKVKVKEKAFEIASWSEFVDWYNEVTSEGYEYNGKIIEGFVIEDAEGKMVKLKLQYYNFWKFMRGIAHEVLRSGYFRRTGSLTTPEANMFYSFCQKLYNDAGTREQRDLIPRDIIYLRNEFYKYMKNTEVKDET